MRNIFCGAALALAAAAPALAQDAPGRDWTFNLLEENDSFIHGDEYYTQGIYLSLFASQRSGADPYFERLSAIADAIMLPAEGGRIHFGGFIGQSIFTPDDIRRKVPDPEDRPYAGWLYGGVSLYRDAGRTLDRATLTLGLVGPGAGGRRVQNGWHDIVAPFFGSPQAEGWSTQLRNEPGLVLSEERKWRFAATLGGLEFDALPHVNVALGNIFTYAGAGGMVRFGRRLQVDWGQPRVQPALSGSDYVNHGVLRDGVAWYVFAGTEGRAVARNIFLDGNTWEDSPDVDRKALVGDLTVGAAVVAGWARLGASYTVRTDEFEDQNGAHDFLAVNLTILF